MLMREVAHVFLLRWNRFINMNDFLLLQGIDLSISKAQDVSQHLLSMLTQERRRSSDGWAGPRVLNRAIQHLQFPQGWVVHLLDHAPSKDY